MALREVVQFPDPRLKKVAESIGTTTDELRELARDMIDVMYDEPGIGLAAPQVGLGMSLLVLNPTGEPSDTSEELILVNPEITSRKTLEWDEEGCLSFPGIYAEIERHRDIELRYRDLTGETREIPSSEFQARVIQHEMDHLLGVLFVDRLTPGDKIRLRGKLQEMERVYRANA